MRNISNLIIRSAACIFAVMLSVSCLLEKEGHSDQMQGVMIQMSVSSGELTKAEPTVSEETINSLRVYAFYGDRLAGYASRQKTSLDEPFYMDLQLPESGNHDVEFYLIANEAEMAYENGLVQFSENMTKSQLEAVKYTGLKHNQVLPMYCKQTETINVDAVSPQANTQSGHQGHVILSQKITFSLSRSLAKLSVYAAKMQGTSVQPEILSVDLLANGTREYSYLFPQTEETLNAVVSRQTNRTLLDAPVTVVNEVEKGSDEALDPANYTTIFTGKYLPEVTYGSSSWNQSSGNDREAVLHVRFTFDGAQIRNGYVYLPPVERNQHIKVCILISAEGQIMINYVVADWDWDEDKMQNWFFDYPTHSYIWHEIPFSADDLKTRPEKAATMSETSPFVGYFQMTYPESDKWTPTLEGLHASHCNIEVYNDWTKEKVFSSDDPTPLPVSEDWYRIEVSPKVGYMALSDKVNLAITYTPGGMTESEYLLINGSHPNYFWEDSTSENYITITMVN